MIFDIQKPLVIFDIGSCEGEDSIKYSKVFPSARIFAVEALPSNLSLLKENLNKYSVKNVEILPFALSDEAGICNFHVSSGQLEDKKEDWDYGNKSSSLLAPTENLDIFPWLKFSNIISVETNTLYNVCIEKDISSIDFVHMDVQGAELKILKGAGKFIKKIKLIWLEVEALELYKDQPLKKEIEEFMRENAFIKVKDTVGDVSGDQLYINSESSLSKITLMQLLLNLYSQKIRNHINRSIKPKIEEFLLIIKSNLSYIKREIKQWFYPASQIRKYSQISHSQCGEDLIVKFIFDNLGIQHPSYIDIGAHDPEYLNNTATFYLSGSIGINIEPDPILFKKFLNTRKRDLNLNIGVADTVDVIDFYFMSSPTLNTFSKIEADKYVEFGYPIVSIGKIKVDKLHNIIKTQWNNSFPDFLSLDVEGLDETILKSIDYEKNYPIVICVETMSFSKNGNGVKNKSIIEFLENNGYLVYADTYINTIFVRKDRWIRT
ncbi:FkbM family methyltransferase [Nodosilinea sp. FACHB-13]|uniref:FkbM family methyltransferase n=1 Tax=Cyanophyceae TaxID=3028117 RepID=UPI00168924FD|nr:FkbM family methyltransferase [Nodosilinea sp. FACHB-13]MBD2107735.1 FkbM family methyltransferase [Nodosilinea sp. FACHB-13]